MCGICGFVYDDATHPVDETWLRVMTSKLSHRGPDATGTVLGHDHKHVALGHTRLAVIDLETGGQPMTTSDGAATIVYNGECYNFRENRHDLEAAGVNFHTHSDTEVVLQLVCRYGVDAPERMNGQFAFAVWDNHKRELLLARDRLGQKPLFWYHGGGRFVFASSLGALLSAGDVPHEIDPVALDAYLALGYVPAPRTIFRNVRKLAPGCTLTLRDGVVREERYWQPPTVEETDADPDVLEDELRELMTDAVHMRLVSDVPLGAWLSGGVDSSIIVALMSERAATPARTFAIGFDDALYNELDYARAVARRHGTDHREFTVRARCAEALEQLVPLFGEPFADSSAVPTWTLARETRAHVTVALSGDGGDELFGGYDRYRAMLLAGAFDDGPAFVRALLRALAVGASGEQRSFRHRLKRFVRALEKDPVARYVAWMSIFDSARREALTTAAFREQLTDERGDDALRDTFARHVSGDAASRAMSVDLETYLPGDLLVKTDVASMAWGLEVRCPFLDHRLVAFARSLPTRMKLTTMRSKRILRSAFRSALPAKVRRRRKMGFGVPLGRWFREELREMLTDVLLSRRARARGLFEDAAVEALLVEHETELADHSARLYTLLFLELWFREFVDR